MRGRATTGRLRRHTTGRRLSSSVTGTECKRRRAVANLPGRRQVGNLLYLPLPAHRHWEAINAGGIVERMQRLTAVAANDWREVLTAIILGHQGTQLQGWLASSQAAGFSLGKPNRPRLPHHQKTQAHNATFSIQATHRCPLPSGPSSGCHSASPRWARPWSTSTFSTEPGNAAVGNGGATGSP
jgi:hypothetical protein